MHQEPDVGFDPGSPGSCPGPKADAKTLHHPGIPFFLFFFFMMTSIYKDKLHILHLASLLQKISMLMFLKYYEKNIFI